MRKGFTLIELIVVIAIILLLSALAFVGYNVLSDNADRQVCETNVAKLDYVYKVQIKLEPSLTKEVYFANLSDYFDVVECPANGTFYLADGVFGCTVHGEAPFDD